MTLTPEQAAAAKELARKDTSFMARAVLHFAEQADEARRAHALGYGAQEGLMQRALVAEAERDALRGDLLDSLPEPLAALIDRTLEGDCVGGGRLLRAVATLTAERDALKADVARLREKVEAAYLSHTDVAIAAINAGHALRHLITATTPLTQEPDAALAGGAVAETPE